MSKYTKEFKLAVVQDYESLKVGSRVLSKKYDVTRSLLKKWIYGYQCHGADYFEKRTQVYSPEFKLSVLQHMKDHHISPTRAAARFGIPAFTSVMPVSYTHLDVYKRQGLQKPFFSAAPGRSGIRW